MNNILALDIGGSELRSLSNQDDTLYRSSPEIKEPFEKELLEFSEGKSGEFIIQVSPFPNLNQRLFVKGKAMQAYQGNILFCDNQNYKVEQEASVANFIWAVAKHALKFNDAIRLGICIPAREYYNQTTQKVFRQALVGSYVVEFPKLGETVKFDLTYENILPASEGSIAFTDYVKSKKLVKQMSTATVLLIDMGYRSTEIVLIKRMVPFGYSADSSPIGGFQLEGEVTRLLSGTGAVEIDARKVLTTGTFGSSDATRVCVTARRIVANDLKKAILSVVSSTREVRNISAIEYLFCVGRPFSETTAIQSIGLATTITEAMNAKWEIRTPEKLGTSNVESLLQALKAVWA